MDYLTKSLILFKNGKISEKEIRDIIVLEVNNILRSFKNLNEDYIQNTITFFIENAVNMAKNFELDKTSFYIYISKSIMFRLKSYKRKGAKNYRNNYINMNLYKTKTEAYYAEEKSQKIYYENNTIVNSINEIIKSKHDENKYGYISRYRILVLLIKNCNNLKDDEIDIICETANLYKPAIFDYLLKARETIISQIQRRELYTGRKNVIMKKLYFANLKNDNLSSTEIINLETRLESLKKKIASLRCSPTNKNIANILNTDIKMVKRASNYLVRYYKRNSFL